MFCIEDESTTSTNLYITLQSQHQIQFLLLTKCVIHSLRHRYRSDARIRFGFRIMETIAFITFIVNKLTSHMDFPVLHIYIRPGQSNCFTHSQTSPEHNLHHWKMWFIYLTILHKFQKFFLLFQSQCFFFFCRGTIISKCSCNRILSDNLVCYCHLKTWVKHSIKAFDRTVCQPFI